MTPTPGTQYRYIGNEPQYRDHRGLVGTVVTATRAGRDYCVELSNVKEWSRLGLACPIFVTSREIEPIEESPAPTKYAGAFKGLESDLVAEIKKTLEEQGYIVAHIGQRKAKGSGTTTGFPDMAVRRASWPDGLACLLEIKTATGTLSPEQEELMKMGWSYVVRSVERAMSALTRFESEVWAK